MDSSDIDRPRAEKLHQQVGSLLRYLKRLRERMTHRGFTADDRLFAKVVRADDAVHSLFVETHELVCGQGLKSAPGELIAHEDIEALLDP